MQSRSRGLGCSCFVLVLIVALLVVLGSALFAPVKTPLLGNLRFTCSLGLTQSNASITVRGPLAGHQCRKLLDQSNAFPVRIFTISNRSGAPIVCSFTESYVKVTIRDDGLLQLLGDNLCTIVKDIVASVGPGSASQSQGVAFHAAFWLPNQADVPRGAA